MATLTLENVVKTYPNGHQAVKGANFSVQDGEFLVLVGPSGCGKSTLLRMIAGLEEVTSGSVSIGDRIVNDVDPADRDIAMVFQNYALYPHMSVAKNMAYGLKNRGVSKSEIEAAVSKAAKMLDIEQYLDRKPSQLSGGQRQRVAMGRAIVRNPALFLFDEPLSNLDAKLRNQMRIEIRRLQRELGVTSVYVTHDQVEAMTMADKIIVLNGGIIEQMGTPAEIYHSPASTFVASFMGAPPMNMLNGKVASSETVELESIGGVSVDLAGTSHGASKSDVAVGIRPENAKLTNKPNGITVPFNLDFVEELGATRLLHGKLGDQSFVVNVAQDAAQPEGDLFIALEKSSLHVFDKASGRRISG